jgi:hypothetical protein
MMQERFISNSLVRQAGSCKYCSRTRKAYRRMPTLCMALVTAILFSTSVLSAQVFRGTISGTVTDQTGAVVQNAQVQATDETTHFTTTVKTNAAGLYTAPFLTPDTYDVEVGSAGFATTKQTGVVLIAGDTKQVDFRLSPAKSTVTLTVTANQEQLQTESPTLSTVFTPNSIENQPNIDGNVFMIAIRTPGVYSGITTEMSGNNQAAGGASGMLIDGIANHHMNTLNGIVDEMPEGSPGGPGYTGFVPPTGTVQEAQVETSVYDAQTGHTWAAGINLVAKTGGEKLHGSAYGVEGTTDFNANTFNNNILNQPRSPASWTEFGFASTGPVRIPKVWHGNDRTFFMVGYRHTRVLSPAPLTASVPTTQERNGDFSQLSATIYDPATTYLGGPTPGWCGSSCVVGNRESFTQEYNEPNSSLCNGDKNCIPSSRINPVATALLPFIPTPNQTGSSSTVPYLGDFTAPGSGYVQYYYSLLARVDEKLNANNTLTFMGLRSVADQFYSNSGWPFVTVSGVAYSAGSEYHNPKSQNGGSIEYTKVISPTLVLDARIGGGYHPASVVRPGYGFNVTNLGMTGATASFPTQTFPQVTATGANGNYGIVTNGASNTTGNTLLTSGAGYFETSSVLENVITVSKTLAKQDIKAGFDYMMTRDDIFSPTSNMGGFNFSQTFTDQTALGSQTASLGGDGFASLLLGYPAGTASAGSTVPTISTADAFGYHYWAAFVQDDWRVTPKLTVNLGVRWDYESPVTERHGRQNAGWDYGDLNPMNQGTACSAASCSPSVTGVNAGKYTGGLLFVGPNYPFAFNRELGDRWQPRIGVAYHIFKYTVLRGGYGTVFSPGGTMGTTTGFTINTQTPIVTLNGNETPATAAGAGCPNADASGFCNLVNPYWAGYTQPSGSSLGLSTAAGGNVSFVDRNYLYPKVKMVSASLQQQFPGGLVIDAAFQGTYGTPYGSSRNINALPACYYFGGGCPSAGIQGSSTTPGTLLYSVPNPMAGYLPATSSLNAATISQQNLYVPYPEFGSVTGTFYQDASRAQRLGGIDYNAWFLSATKRISRGLEFNASTTVAKIMNGTAFLNPTDIKTTRYEDAQPNRFIVATVLYTLPKFNVHGVFGQVVNGWKVDNSFNWQNGTLVGLPGSAFITGNSQKAAQKSLSHWFDTCYIPVLASATVSNPTITYGGPTDATTTGHACRAGEQPAWIQQPTQTLNQVAGNMRGVRIQVVPYLDTSLVKGFEIREGIGVEIRADAHNVINDDLLGSGPATGLTASSFGANTASSINGTTYYSQGNDPRMIRLGASIHF